EAAPRGGGDLGLPRAIEQLLALGAAEPVRSPGAALVDEDDVALAPDARKGGSDRRIELARRLPRTPGEDEERIGLLATADRRHARDGEADLPPAGDVRILRDGEHAALRRHHRVQQRVLDLAGSEIERCGRRGRAAGGKAEREQNGGARGSRVKGMRDIRHRMTTITVPRGHRATATNAK